MGYAVFECKSDSSSDMSKMPAVEVAITGVVTVTQMCSCTLD